MEASKFVKTVINNFDITTQFIEDYCKASQMITFIIPMGIVNGKIFKDILDGNEDNSETELLPKILNFTVDQTKRIIDDKNNQETITLKDVTVFSNGQKFTLPGMVLFINQIIGISIGNFTENKNEEV